MISCGTVKGPEPEDLEVEVFTDQLCSRCGHPPCPCCYWFCDTSVPIPSSRDPHAWEMCACVHETGACTFVRDPRFFTSDGKAWDK